LAGDTLALLGEVDEAYGGFEARWIKSADPALDDAETETPELEAESLISGPDNIADSYPLEYVLTDEDVGIVSFIFSVSDTAALEAGYSNPEVAELEAAIDVEVLQPQLVVRKPAELDCETKISYGDKHWYALGSGESIYTEGLTRGVYSAESYAPYAFAGRETAEADISLYWDEDANDWGGHVQEMELGPAEDEPVAEPWYFHAYARSEEDKPQDGLSPMVDTPAIEPERRPSEPAGGDA
jgi:hypothetical protein